MNILPQMGQITQRNAASCIISQRKTVSSGGVVVAVIVVWGLSAIISVICERLWDFFFCADCLSTLACYSPADGADHADKECSKLHYIAEKDSLLVSVVVIVVWGLSALISVISVRHWGFFFCAVCLSTLAYYSLADNADNADKECSKLHYFSEKQLVWGYELTIVFLLML